MLPTSWAKRRNRCSDQGGIGHDEGRHESGGFIKYVRPAFVRQGKKSLMTLTQTAHKLRETTTDNRKQCHIRLWKSLGGAM